MKRDPRPGGYPSLCFFFGSGDSKGVRGVTLACSEIRLSMNETSGDGKGAGVQPRLPAKTRTNSSRSLLYCQEDNDNVQLLVRVDR